MFIVTLTSAALGAGILVKIGFEIYKHARYRRSIGSGGTVRGIVQEWFLVNDEEPIRRLTGIIKKIGLNYQSIVDDGDWNIFIKPEHSYELLENSLGNQNSDGLIELEIHNPLPLDQFFKKTDRITAYGWHVEDTGHVYNNPKTELHPVMFMMKDETKDEEFTIFVGRDNSDRFDYDVKYDEFSFDVPITMARPKLVDIFDSIPSATKILEEISLVDFVDIKGEPLAEREGRGDWEPWQRLLSIRQTLSEWNEQGSKITVDWDSDRLNLKILFPKINPLAEKGEVVSFYLGKFKRSEEPLLNDPISFEIVRESGGQNYLSVTIPLTLENPRIGSPLVYSRWIFERSNFDNGKKEQVENVIENESHQAEIQIKYSPKLGFSDSSFFLDVIGSTRPRDWIPGKRTNVDQAGNRNIPYENRKFVHENRVYTFETSWINLKLKKGYKSLVRDTDPRNPHGESVGPMCMMSATISLTKFIMLDIAHTVKWYVDRIQTTDEVETTKTDKILLESIIEQISNNKEHKYGKEIPATGLTLYDPDIDIFFDDTGENLNVEYRTFPTRHPGLEDLFIPTHRSPIRITAILETEIGEVMTKSVMLIQEPCGVGKTFTETMEDIKKGIIAEAKLREKGILVDPINPETWIPPSPPGINWKKEMVFEKYFERNLPKKEQMVLKNFKKWSVGGEISETDLKDIQRAIFIGSRIPVNP